MTGMMLYLSLGLMVLTVLSNRYWRRQLEGLRQGQLRIREKMEEVGKDVEDIAAAYSQVTQKHAEAEKRALKAEQDMQAALNELEARQTAPVVRYHVFDRSEPRPGRFWEAAVRHVPSDATVMTGQRGWLGIRRCLLTAETEREVRERVSARYPRKAGFQVLEVVPCRVAGLSVNRIPELSTFRRSAPPEEAARLRTGTVLTYDDRNWELRWAQERPLINLSRAVAVDMESGTIAAQGYRLRVPYGTLLCVSDKPLHSEIKLPGAAGAFYERAVTQHLHIGIAALDLMRSQLNSLHSRKLRSFDEPPFR